METKRVAAVVTALLIACQLHTTIFAHPASQASLFDSTTRNGYTYVGNESMGWIIDEAHHTNSSSLYYKYDSSVSSVLRDKVDDGADKWKVEGEPFSVNIRQLVPEL